MSSLTEGHCFNYTVLEQSKKSVVFVKLTDSALKAIEECIENQDSSKPSIQFENSQGQLRVPQNEETKQFSFSLSNIINDGSFECVQQGGNGSLKSVGSMEMKMLIHANEDSYVNTKNKMAAADKLQKQNCVKEINAAGSCSSWKVNGQHKKPINIVPVDSVTPFVLKKSLPVKAGLSKTNLDIVNESIRHRLIHILAVRPYKKPELLLRLSNEGMSEEGKNRLVRDLAQVAVLKKNAYQLADRMWSEVQDKWKYYTPEDAALVQKKKQRYLQNSKSSPLNDQPSSLPADINCPGKGLPGIYPLVKKQRVSRLNQKSSNDDVPGVLPKKELSKLCSSSESEIKNINCPAKSAKRKRRKNRKRKSKNQGKNSLEKLTSPEDEKKNGKQSSPVQFSNKLFKNKEEKSRILVPFVKSSDLGEQMSSFQSVPVSSLNLEQKNTKPPSLGCIVNGSRELLLKSNGVGCQSNAVHQVSSALKPFAPLDKTNDIVQTSLPAINGDSEFRMQCSNQVHSLEEIPMVCPDNQILNVNQVLHSVAIPALDSDPENEMHDPIRGADSIQSTIQNATNCGIKENGPVHHSVVPMLFNNTGQIMQAGSQILHSAASRMLCNNSNSQSQVPSQNGPSATSGMQFNNSSYERQGSSQNGPVTASQVPYNNSSSKMQDSSQNHPLTAPYTLFNNSDSEMQDSSQNRPSVACRRLFSNPGSELQGNRRVPSSTESAMECDAASYEMLSTPTTMLPVHPSDIHDYKKQYFKIVSHEQRSLYKDHFNAEYPEYIELFHRFKNKCRELEFLENTLKSCRKGTEEYTKVRKTASEVYKTCIKDRKSVRRRDFLHEKLHHIRKLITEYDLEQMEAS